MNKLDIRKYMVKLYRKLVGLLPFKTVIYMDYFIKQKKILNVENPQSFTEKMQWIKLYGGLEKYSYLVDKYAVRKFVEDKIGGQYLNEIYGVYESVSDINFETLPNQFVFKLNNGSSYNLICKDKSLLDEDKTKKMLEKWMKVDFYKEHKEIQYKNVSSKIIIEKYLEDESGELRDYKIFCADGKAQFIQVDSSRFSNHKQNMYDLQWNKLNLKFGHESSEIIDDKPEKLDEMIMLSEKLSKEIPFARIDFYYVNNVIYFGEITLTPQNGLVKFEPKSEDTKIANMIDLKKYN